MPELTRNDKKIKEAFQNLRQAIQDYMPTGSHKAMIQQFVETGYMVFLGVTVRKDEL